MAPSCMPLVAHKLPVHTIQSLEIDIFRIGIGIKYNEQGR